MIILRGFLLLKCLIFLLIYFVNIQYYIYIYIHTSIKTLFLGGGKSKKGVNAKRRTYFLKHA